MDLDQLRTSLAALAKAAHVPGAQLAVLHEGNLHLAESGEVRWRSGRPMTPDSKVPVGSITKTFTATLAMVLVSDGDIELDEPVGHYIPALRRVSADLAGELTLRHLLSHTGGLAAECGDGMDTLQSPGSGFSYSNLGYALAGRLIESITGMTWWEAMEAILLKPLGLAPAFVGRPGTPIVSGHAVNSIQHRIRPVEQALEPAEAPAGGLAASASDLVRLGCMHLRPEHGGTDDQLVEPAELAEMRRPDRAADPFGLADGWGLGLALFRESSTEWIGHDGMADGTSCHLRINPSTGTVVALTTNASTGQTLWHGVTEHLRSVGIDVGDYDVLTGSERRVSPPRDCSGRYFNGDTEYSVAVQDGGLLLVVDSEPLAKLTAHDGLVFSVTGLDTGEQATPGRFLTDAHGRIDRIQIGGRVAGRRRRTRQVA